MFDFFGLWSRLQFCENYLNYLLFHEYKWTISLCVCVFDHHTLLKIYPIRSPRQVKHIVA